MGGPRRGLAAVLFADMVGYSAMMHADEEQAIRRRERFRRAVRKAAETHGGDIVQHYGDGVLIIFGSAAGAAMAGTALQAALRTGEEVEVRVGVHLGDVVRDLDGAYGDGVNLAARVEAACPAGAVLLSGPVARELRNQRNIATLSLGAFALKNIPAPVQLFALVDASLHVPSPEDVEKRVARAPRVGQAGGPEATSPVAFPFLGELSRRRVLRVAATYMLVAMAVVSLVESAAPYVGLSEGLIRNVLFGFVLGFPPSMVLAWLFDIEPVGVVVTTEKG